MTRSSVLWKQLATDVETLLEGVKTCVEQQGSTERWTLLARAQALELLRRLGQAWTQERVDLDALWALKALTGQLDLSATVACRAALEAVHDHLRRIVELTYEDMAVGE